MDNEKSGIRFARFTDGKVQLDLDSFEFDAIKEKNNSDNSKKNARKQL